MAMGWMMLLLELIIPLPLNRSAAGSSYVIYGKKGGYPAPIEYLLP